ncbi:MAG: hypothetical protein J5656_02850 [Clostridia bacterium]|nr:hypothetical protein [Clostridia bacterium]
MTSILTLPASLRITMFVFETLTASALLFGIIYLAISRGQKLRIAYLSALLGCLIIAIVTRTPLMENMNVTVANYISLAFIIPATLSIVLLIKEKKWIRILDCIWCIFNITLLEVIPYYGYIVSGLFVYIMIRTIFFLVESLTSIKDYPGRFSVKYALDKQDDSIAYIDIFGHVRYINTSLKTTLSKLGISSYNNSRDILSLIKRKAIEDGRIVSGTSFIINIEDSSYKFSIDNPLTQITCTDVTEEERLMSEIEENKTNLYKANQELNNTLETIESIQQYNELLTIKGNIHDSLAQQLSILHMFILNDNSTDLREVKKMLSNLDSSLSIEENKGQDGKELQELLRVIGVDLTINGISPDNRDIRVFINKLIKETTTNAIRHGKANKIDVDIKDNGNYLTINITNNGIIPSEVTYGNGLTSIENELRKINGSMSIKLEPYFTIIAKIDY